MKVLEKVKKGLISFGVWLMMLPSRIFATNIYPDPLYGLSAKDLEMERIKQESLMKRDIINKCKMVLIPLVVLIGIIIYLKKSKASKKKKILVVCGIVGIAVIVYYLLTLIVNRLLLN